MTVHSVRLPHPDRTEPTVASCRCGGWSITYGWGQHGEATAAAHAHVGDASQTLTIETCRGDGSRGVLAGRSR